MSEKDIHRGADYQGNTVRRAALEIVDTPPVFGTDIAAGNYGPAQQFMMRITGRICWYTEAGVLMCAGEAIPSMPVAQINLPDAGAYDLPTEFALFVSHVNIDLLDQVADLSLDNWALTSSAPVVEVRVRKLNNTPFKITWTDPVHGNVSDFVDNNGDFITLLWDRATSSFSLI